MRWFNDERDWFPEAKFGMFAHFGLYTLLGGNENMVRKTTSKSDYQKLMKSFNPKKFDAAAWVELAVEAGAKYLVPTVKHAEGFCLWDSDITEIKTTRTPFKRDILMELSAACRKRKLRLGVYYNCETWLNEGDDIWNKRGMSYADFVEEQIRELMTEYGTISALWFDHYHPQLSPERMKKIIRMTHRLQPACVVNDRGVNLAASKKMSGDFITPERFIPTSFDKKHPFVECCDAIGVKSWGYHKKETFWTAPELIKRLSACMTLGFNYLLNVEPEPSGIIRPECVERMHAVGAWIKRNKAAFTAVACPLVPADPSVLDLPPLGRVTSSGNELFVHLHRPPSADECIIRHVTGDVKNAVILGEGKRLRTVLQQDGLHVCGLPAMIGSEPLVVKVSFMKAFRIAKSALGEVGNVVRPSPGGALLLSPENVTLKAANGVCRHARYHRVDKHGRGQTAICNLFNLGDQMRWSVELKKGGVFNVFIELGTAKSQTDAEFIVTSGSTKIRGTTWLTGGCEKPESKKIGELKLTSGKNAVTLKVDKISKSSFADVYSLVLMPKAR